jgi:catechol 2,3-dioxygenase-like lactoylglutathione lyase family enzyme
MNMLECTTLSISYTLTQLKRFKELPQLTMRVGLIMIACLSGVAMLPCQAFAPPPQLRQPRRRLATTAANLFTSDNGDNTPVHHMAIKTRDIEMAIKFYSLLDFEVETKFLAGNVRAAWLQQEANKNSVRLELIEIPSHMLNEPDGKRRRAVDLVQRPELLGLNHYAIDVTNSMKRKNMRTMEQWVEHLNKKSKEKFGKTLRVAVEPFEQMIGQNLYQLAFIYDADGALIELIFQQKKFRQDMISGWYV